MRTQRQTLSANPFAMMMDPQAVVDAMQRSSRLGDLNRRVCRPLDKPLIPKSMTPEMLAFDRELEGESGPVASDSDDTR